MVENSGNEDRQRMAISSRLKLLQCLVTLREASYVPQPNLHKSYYLIPPIYLAD
jgi:hypothetical protein